MPQKDKYHTYDELSTYEKEGDDYRIEVLAGDERSSELVIIAPHGGGIEPGTSQIAEKIAGKDFNLYRFEGMKPNCNFDTLHISSTRFNEPRCLELVEQAHTAVAVHGKAEKGRNVLVGGLDGELAESITTELSNAGFAVDRVKSGPVSGTDEENICNRTASGKGVQLEIHRQLRNELAESVPLMRDFVSSIRRVLSTHHEAISENL